MGQLKFYTAVDAEWNFKDYYFNGDRYKFKWPNEAYPVMVSIHEKHLKDVDGLKVQINHWIEDNLSETVIYDILDNSYRVVHKDVESWKQWERSWDVSNNWYRFFFRKEESATIFKLKFSEYITPITEDSPFTGWDKESGYVRM